MSEWLQHLIEHPPRISKRLVHAEPSPPRMVKWSSQEDRSEHHFERVAT